MSAIYHEDLQCWAAEGAPIYRVTKLHIGGIMDGLTTTAHSAYKAQDCQRALGGGGYKVLECVAVR